jgi:hypothetical protein
MRRLRTAAQHNVEGWRNAVQSSTTRHIKAGLAAYRAQHSTQVGIVLYSTTSGMMPHSSSGQHSFDSTARFRGCTPLCTTAHIPPSPTLTHLDHLAQLQRRLVLPGGAVTPATNNRLHGLQLR